MQKNAQTSNAQVSCAVSEEAVLLFGNLNLGHVESGITKQVIPLQSVLLKETQLRILLFNAAIKILYIQVEISLH
jgi:hypothetical protein